MHNFPMEDCVVTIFRPLHMVVAQLIYDVTPQTQSAAGERRKGIISQRMIKQEVVPPHEYIVCRNKVDAKKVLSLSAKRYPLKQ